MDTDPTTSLPSPPPPNTAVPRFTLELEFVSSLANPLYLQHLGTTHHHLLNPPESSSSPSTATDTTTNTNTNTDAAKFARYLTYLLYWKQPQYARYLTHPAATIRNLELLQTQPFRASVQHPELTVKLSEGFAGTQIYEAPGVGVGDGPDEAGREREGEQQGAGPDATVMVNGAGPVIISGPG